MSGDAGTLYHSPRTAALLNGPKREKDRASNHRELVSTRGKSWHCIRKPYIRVYRRALGGTEPARSSLWRAEGRVEGTRVASGGGVRKGVLNWENLSVIGPGSGRLRACTTYRL